MLIIYIEIKRFGLKFFIKCHLSVESVESLHLKTHKCTEKKMRSEFFLSRDILMFLYAAHKTRDHPNHPNFDFGAVYTYPNSLT